MRILPITLALLIMTLSACSTTSKVTMEKKPLISDHYLMMSLLNRPITQDQQMMMAFAEQRTTYSQPLFVHVVEIKGEKDHSSTLSAIHTYSTLIAQDFNSVRISGPN